MHRSIIQGKGVCFTSIRYNDFLIPNAMAKEKRKKNEYSHPNKFHVASELGLLLSLTYPQLQLFVGGEETLRELLEAANN